MTLKKKYPSHFFLLLLWIVLGLILRFHNLELKPPWSDEWATIVFSLGNSFKSVPLNEIISLDTLLSPLKFNAHNRVTDTIHNLLTESTHPPLYFMLNHFWWQVIGENNNLISIWWARCLSSLLGVVSIPAIFCLSWLLFKSSIASHISSALMAVSPFAIYLSQEARHYTLAILWIMASLACLSITIRCLQKNKSISIEIIFIWILVNCLGIATHYFFSLTLVALVLVLVSFLWNQKAAKNKPTEHLIKIGNNNWRKIYLAIVVTIIGCLPWVITWKNIPDNQLTSWVFEGNPLSQFYEPIGRIFIWLITMVFLLPIEGVKDSIAIISGIILLSFLLWLLPSLISSFKNLRQSVLTRFSLITIGRFISIAILLILSITYIFGADLTLSSRFQFIYFPGIILFLGILLSYIWNIGDRGKNKIIILILLGLCGALSINHNLAFQKVERPDLVVPKIIEAYNNSNLDIPVVIATHHLTHGQTGEMMSLGWQFNKLKEKNKLKFNPQFLLAHQGDRTSLNIVRENLKKLDTSFQLWLINFPSSSRLKNTRCLPDREYKGRTTGYKYQLYNCR